MKQEYKNKIFRLSGSEGGDWDKLKVSGVPWKTKKGSINYYVAVVGFEDKKCPQRNWGVNSFSKNVFFNLKNILIGFLKRK